ncbi:MAG: hypothetical protein ACREF4_14265 [Gammaproteobacteria bacterium]
MDALGFRLLVLANVVIPLLFFMAWVYLGLHVVFARFVSPDSPVAWFFNVVTGPLTRPVRTVLSPATPERRVRMVALLTYFVLWIAVRALFALLLPPRAG